LQDPRTSAPGLAFLLYTAAVYSEESTFKNFWDRFKTQWLTLPPSWSQAYGLFLKAEVPLVWSYTTSEAYHREKADKKGLLPSESERNRYRALLFEEGQPLHIEGAFVVSRTLKKEEARLSPLEFRALRNRIQIFLDTLMSDEIQEAIPRTQWMFPARAGVRLPESFRQLPQPKKVVPLDYRRESLEKNLASWRKRVQ
jgi:thiamine transport system substrate-binding protein